MSSSSSPAPRGISPGLFIITLLLAVAASAGVTTAIHLWAGPRAQGGGERNSALTTSTVSITQKDTVSPDNKHTGMVFYPMPYASPPSLKFTSSKRKYEIVKQDELGFTWVARPMLEDFIKEPPGNLKPEDYLNMNLEGIMAVAKGLLKPHINYEDFSYEASGLQGSGRVSAARPFEQNGQFNSIPSTEGEVAFEIPYVLPPNVQFTGFQRSTTITQIKPTGFKWKNGGKDPFHDGGIITWTAKGIRATDLSKVKAE